MPAAAEFRYRAFISYSHADTKSANWLHGRLESFRIDRDLVGRQTAVGAIPKTLRPIFRDRYDFTAGHSLSEQTLAALDASAALILLCSPASATSRYVNEEVRLFKQRHPDRPIIPVILDGKPGDPAAECFPPALKFEVAADDSITDRPIDVLAADVRQTADGPDLALAKVVAELIGVPTDDVRKRQVIGQSWRLKVVGVVATSIAALALVAGFLLWQYEQQISIDESREKERVRREVARDAQLSELRGLVQSLLAVSAAHGAPGAAKAVGDAVAEAAEGAARGDDRLKKALELLKAGKLQDAEQLFRAVAEEKATRVQTAKARIENDSREAAAAYRNLGAIAGLADPKRAREAYAIALDFNPDDLEALYWYGYLSFLAGNLSAAKPSLERLMEAATVRGDRRGLYRAHLVLGQVMQQGRPRSQQARESAKTALDIALFEADSTKDDLQWQRDVLEARIRLGEVLRYQGDLEGALENYTAALEIAQRLTKTDPQNANWQHDLSVVHEKIGLALEYRNQLVEALDNYQASVAIAERLVKIDPKNASWWRLLSVSHDRVGDVLLSEGNLAAALNSFKASFEIAERLAKGDPDNAGWQHDLVVAHSNIGHVLKEQGNLAAALNSYKASFEIAERLAKGDPDNAGWQHDLAAAYESVANVEEGQGARDAALGALKRARDIIARLKAEAPDDTSLGPNLERLERRIEGRPTKPRRYVPSVSQSPYATRPTIRRYSGGPHVIRRYSDRPWRPQILEKRERR